ncbi:MAG: GAF domain-containing protein [Acidobacteria bacterium]|nr:GAF domain-containing protein [Acidobacteriota bacterium]
MSSLSGCHEHLLVIGDEVKSAQSLKRLVESSGYAATAVECFSDALNQIALHHPSLIIIEPSASRVTGMLKPTHDDEPSSSLQKLHWAQEALQFCVAIREHTASSDIPILVISKNPLPQDKIAWLNAGATVYLTKPVPKGELLSRIKSLLKVWQQGKVKSEKFEQLHLLHSVSSVLSSSLNPEVLLRGTLQALIKGLNASAGVVYLRTPDKQAMSVVAAEGFSAEDDWDGCLLDFYFGTVAHMKKEPLILNAIHDTGGLKLPDDRLQEMYGVVCAPIGLKDEVAGAICLFSNTRTAFTKPYAELLSTICNQLSVALENARLYIETTKSASQLSFVYNLSNNLMTSLEFDELLSYAVFSVGKTLQCDVCAVLVKTSLQSQKIAAAKYSKTLAGPQSHNDWYDKDAIEKYFEESRGGLHSSIEIRVTNRFIGDEKILLETIVPLMFDNKLLGIMICGSSNARSFTLDDQKLLSAVAHQLSLAIRNIELYQNTKDTSINLAVEVARRTQEIEEQKRFTEKIIDSLPVSLYVVDSDMKIVAWNQSREDGIGINRSDAIGRNVFSVLTKQPRTQLHKEFMEVFRSGKIIQFEQESHANGQKQVWKISKIPMRVDNAEVSHVITVGEEITEQKKMNDAVMHADKLASIGRLAAGVVHEINNPLATISACAEALVSRMLEINPGDIQDDFKEYLQIIKDEAFRCKTITNSLLEFSHQRQAEKIQCDINHLIDQTLLLLKHHPRIGKMKIHKELDNTLGNVLVNEGQMKQLFIALISNAYDAMERDGELTIRTRWLSGETAWRVCAEFADNGCGIPAAIKSKIFDPFFTTKEIGKGTGLGLSVCYGIVTDHGGKIEVESSEGHGSTFRVLLPVISTGNYLPPLLTEYHTESIL